MNIEDGGPAFPRSIGYGTIMIAGEPRNLEVSPQGGMSLRDWFAGQALKGLLASQSHPDSNGAPTSVEGTEPYVRMAYCIADAMLAERDKEVPNT